MKRILHIVIVFLLTTVITLANSPVVLADGEAGEHALEMEVNGIHVSLADQHEWKKGENTIVVTLKDGTGSPVSDADVAVLIGLKSDEHTAVKESHGSSITVSGHGAEQEHASISEIEMSDHGAETSVGPAHDEVLHPPHCKRTGGARNLRCRDPF